MFEGSGKVTLPTSDLHVTAVEFDGTSGSIASQLQIDEASTQTPIQLEGGWVSLANESSCAVEVDCIVSHVASGITMRHDLKVKPLTNKQLRRISNQS